MKPLFLSYDDYWDILRGTWMMVTWKEILPVHFCSVFAGVPRIVLVLLCWALSGKCTHLDSNVLQIMRETLIYLSHLDHEDTEQQVTDYWWYSSFSYYTYIFLSFLCSLTNYSCWFLFLNACWEMHSETDWSFKLVFSNCVFQMLKKLNKQLSGEEWTWNNLNTLCWAIGSISGSMAEEQVFTGRFSFTLSLGLLFSSFCQAGGLRFFSLGK